jgi:hypothetical protein
MVGTQSVDGDDDNDDGGRSSGRGQRSEVCKEKAGDPQKY